MFWKKPNAGRFHGDTESPVEETPEDSSGSERKNRLEKIGLIAVVVVVAGLILFVVGLFQGWFRVSVDNREDGINLTLGVDGNEIVSDASALVDEADVVASLTTSKGTVSGIDRENAKITFDMEGDGDSTTVLVNEATEIQVDGEETTLDAVTEGDQATIVFHAQDENRVALKIEVDRSESDA